MAVDYNELLYEKLQAEYNAYIESLKQMTPEQVIENAYQKVFKEDLIIAFESVNLEPLEAKEIPAHWSLISTSRPLGRKLIRPKWRQIFSKTSN